MIRFGIFIIPISISNDVPNMFSIFWSRGSTSLSNQIQLSRSVAEGDEVLPDNFPLTPIP